MRILFALNSHYLPQFTGGAEYCTHALCTGLRARGFAVAVLAGLSTNGFVGLLNRAMRRLRPSVQFPTDRVMGYPVYRGWHPVDGPAEVTRRFRPSVAVVQAGRRVPMAEALRAQGLPTVIYHQEAESCEEEPMPLGDQVLHIANSNFAADYFAQRHGIRPHVVPPFIFPERYRTHTTRERVVFVNPIMCKGVNMAVTLADRRPDIPFEFVESWPLADDILGPLLERCGKRKNITLRRRTSDMRKVYRTARLVLVPSQWRETWGRIVTEAHFNGIPVLASDRGGLPESVGPGGIIVPSSAPVAEWESALSRLWDDASEYQRLCHAALEYSKRQAIQPEYLLTRFVTLLSQHVGSRPPGKGAGPGKDP